MRRGPLDPPAWLVGLMLAACGSTPAILPPNTVQACDRAVECKAVTTADHEQCVTCLEHADPEKVQALEPYLETTSIERWPCDDLVSYYARSNVSLCVEAKWHWDQYFVSRYQGCDRAIECGIFTAEQRPECVECGGTVEDSWNAEAVDACHGGCPPIGIVPCSFIEAQMVKRDFVACVQERRFGP